MKTLFLRGFILKPTERALVLLKNCTRDIQNSPRFERSACFYVRISENFSNVFNTLKQIYWKTKTFFKKLKYRFLIESAKIENASFPFKAVKSKANIKANRMMSTKWTYTKNGGLPVTALIFWKFCFNLRTSYKELI